MELGKRFLWFKTNKGKSQKPLLQVKFTYNHRFACGVCTRCKVKETHCFGCLIWACEITSGGPPSPDWISSNIRWLTNIEQVTLFVFPDSSTINPLAPIAPSSLTLSAERIMINFCLEVTVPHKILIVFSSIANQSRMSVKRASWKCCVFVRVSLELANCTVLTCWIVCSIDSSEKLLIPERSSSSWAKRQQLGWSLSVTLGPSHHWQGCMD